MGNFRTYKYRIYPTKAQATNLENQFSMCRHLYNWALLERKEAYLKKGRSITYQQQQNALPELKKERPWFKAVHSQVLQDVLRRLDRAYLKFYRRVKKGDFSGFPKFKKLGQWNSITYPQCKDRPGNTIRVPKAGNLKIRMHRPIPETAEVKTLTVTKEFEKWFVCFSVAFYEPSPALRALSDFRSNIDVGLIDLVEAYDEHFAATPKYQHLIKRLALLKGKLHEEKKRSQQWYRLQKAIEKVRFKRQCMQSDFLHKEANRHLLKSNMIVHEDIDVRALESCTSPKRIEGQACETYPSSFKMYDTKKKILDVGWNMFLQILWYKATDQGKQVLAIPSQYIAEICTNCGTITRKAHTKNKQYCRCGCPQLQTDEKTAKYTYRAGYAGSESRLHA